MPVRRRSILPVTFLAVAMAIGLFGSSVWSSDGGTPSSAAGDVILVGAGDISKCTNNND